MAVEATQPAPDNGALDLLSLDEMLAEADRAEARERQQSTPKRAEDLQDARRVVRDELALKTLGRDLTPAMEDALQRAWLPLMSVILSRRGMNSRPWQMGVELLESLLDLADPPDEQPAKPLTITRGVDRLARALRHIGVPPAGVGTIYSRLLAAFSQSFSVAENGSAARLANSQLVSLLREVLVQDNWFEFAGEPPEWLKPQSLSIEGRFVCFARADGSGERSLNFGQFLDQLVEGRIFPVQPSPRARVLLDELIAHRLATAGI